ncbi:MAG: xanthine dehydrogenase accessory factor [Flavobacteriales bacterium]|jgi:xanthine/CO dehydrogenase XdhC/CoxF family maturation factor
MQAFELKESIKFYRSALQCDLKTVMASLVGLDGSSYRKPGVRMLIGQDGTMCGALSGGCVENEIIASAQSVFKTGISKVISYDGRYRLGCEGLMYILIEPFKLSNDAVNQLLKQVDNRHPIEIISKYKEGTTEIGSFHSTFHVPAARISIQTNTLKFQEGVQFSVFKQTIAPAHHLIIVGAEHDAEKLCASAALLGWDITIVSSPKDSKTIQDFPGAKYLLAQSPEAIDFSTIDAHTAIVLMTHNYALDLKFLLTIKDIDVPYIGILGSQKRKTSLENDLLEHAPELRVDFLENIHSPAGLDIGAVTPQEIAISILSEILKVMRYTRKPSPSTTAIVKSTLS